MGTNKARFILKEPRSDKDTLIFLTYRDGFRFKFSTREKIHPDNWNAQKMRMREIRGLPYINFNRRLDSIERTFDDVILLLKNENRYNIANIQKELNFALQMKSKETLFDFMQSYVAQRTSEGDYERCKSVQTTMNILKRYMTEKHVDLNYNTISESFFEKFIAWMNEQKYSSNYTGKMISNIKRMMNKSMKAGLHKNEQFRLVAKMQEDVYKVYLSVDEIKKIIDVELLPYLANARDLFVIGCYTGLRVGNYLKIDPAVQIDTTSGYIQAICNKNGPRVKIPIHPEVKKILTRHSGFPHSISDVKLNLYIKKVAELAGINDPVIWHRTEGGRRVEYVNRKYDLITSHTARRSFATNAYKAGILPFEIMQITGHSSEKTFFKYIKITQEEAAERMKKHAFFN